MTLPVGQYEVPSGLFYGGARAEETTNGDVVIRATQAELARLAGSSRESASRFLAVLERAGIISQGRGRLTVHDPAAVRTAGGLHGPLVEAERHREPVITSQSGCR